MWERQKILGAEYHGTSKEWKRSWVDSTQADLVRKGHSKQYARAKAKLMYREMSR